MDFDIVLATQILDGVHIAHTLVFHHEVDDVATLATAKALENSLGGRHHKRRCLLGVERTAGLIVSTLTTQRDKVADNIHDVGCRINSVYGDLVNHLS